MRRLLACLSLVLLLSPLVGAADAVFQSGGVAIKGYDPVAYFTLAVPTQGSEKFSHEWNGASWQFSTQENRDLFAESPEQYAPAYGGWCAYAMAQGSLASIDPEAFTLHEGRLFLNYSKRIEKKWRAKRDGYIEAADKKYPELVSP